MCSQVWRKQCLFKLAWAVEVYQVNWSWWTPCKFIKLRAVVEFYFMETTLIFGINLLVAVPTTLCSVWSASYLSSKSLPAYNILIRLTIVPHMRTKNYKTKNRTRLLYPLQSCKQLDLIKHTSFISYMEDKKKLDKGDIFPLTLYNMISCR